MNSDLERAGSPQEDAAGRYAGRILEILGCIQEKKQLAMGAAGAAVARAVRNGGIVHVFGTGHSHLLAEELFYRAGGPAFVNAVLDPALMLHTGAVSSTRVERLEGYGSILYEKQAFRAEDLLIIVSNSGVNAVPVEFARQAKRDGLTVIALLSVAYARSIRPDGEGSLLALADLVLDNHCPPGDAVSTLGPLSIGPASTIAGAFILHQVMIRAAEQLGTRGQAPPVFKSANMPGAEAHNKALIERYSDR